MVAAVLFGLQLLRLEKQSVVDQEVELFGRHFDVVLTQVQVALHAELSDGFEVVSHLPNHEHL